MGTHPHSLMRVDYDTFALDRLTLKVAGRHCLYKYIQRNFDFA